MIKYLQVCFVSSSDTTKSAGLWPGVQIRSTFPIPKFPSPFHPNTLTPDNPPMPTPTTTQHQDPSTKHT